MKDITTVSEKSATVAKSESAVAAPSPEMNPERWLLLSVRWIHITPIGPSGIDATSPMTIPFNSAINSIPTEKE